MITIERELARLDRSVDADVEVRFELRSDID